MTTHLAILTDPAGVSAFLCYAAPGLTQDRSAATAFASEHVARRERKGWTATTEAKETGQ